MFKADDYRLKIQAMRGVLAEAGYALDLENQKTRLEELKTEQEKPEVWQDLERSTKIGREISHIQNKITAYEKSDAALSDAEVEYTEKDSVLWHIRYPVKDSDKYVVIATTRPETLLGDTAVAVNPKDERYKDILGKTLILPIVGREIPLIADDYCEIGFGTGAVKITPAHDPNDFEVGLRHNLDVILVMDDSGIMNENAGKYQGLTRDECRQQIVEDLKEQGFLVKIEPYKHNVG